MDRVKGKIALITGASRGIGAKTAEVLAVEGAIVIVTDILDDLGAKVAKNISGEYFHLDVSSEDEWNSLEKHIKNKYGKLDIIFNNAGITGLNEDLGPQDPENATLESWQHLHKINLDSVFLGCRMAIRLMKEKGGSIINMSSRSGVVGVPGAAAYASTKAAIRNHTKSVALYCADNKYNVRCNSVDPAAILTPIWDSMLDGDIKSREKAIAGIAAGIPLGHMGEPEDVAYAVLYLASDESKYITGTDITIDGGILSGSSSSVKSKDGPK